MNAKAGSTPWTIAVDSFAIVFFSVLCTSRVVALCSRDRTVFPPQAGVSRAPREWYYEYLSTIYKTYDIKKPAEKYYNSHVNILKFTVCVNV
jgi:hypothetical protein